MSSPNQSTAIAPTFAGLPPVEFQSMESTRGAYVAFPKASSQQFPSIKAVFPDYREYEPVLVKDQNEYVRISDGTNCFHAFIATAFQCWAQVDNKYKILKAWKEDPGIKDQNGRYIAQETCEAVLIVVANGQLYPCRGTFRSATASVIRRAVRMIGDGETPAEFLDPDWLKSSKQHAKMAKIQPVWLRGYHKIRVTKRVGKSNEYPEATSVVEPCSDEYGQLIMAALKDSEFDAMFQNAIRFYEQRVNEAKSKIVAVAA